MALPAVQFLLSSGLPVELAITDVDNQDTPEIRHFLTSAGKQYTAVSKSALAVGLKRWIERYKLDVVLVITFPWKIPAYTLTLPRLGFFNFHYALLPGYRGAQPIFWQIRNGEKYGGLTIHKMDGGWDTGPVAQQVNIELRPGETYGLHYSRISWQTLPAVQEFVSKVLKYGDSIQLTPQDNTAANYHPRPQLTDVTINWQQMNAIEIQRLVNACNPWNKGAVTYYNQIAFKIVQVSIKEHKYVNNQNLKPGTVINCLKKKTIDIMTVDNDILTIEIINTDWGFTDASVLIAQGIVEGAVLGL